MTLPNLESCSSDELASFIYQRFNSDVNQAKEFMSKASAKLTNLANEQILVDNDEDLEKGEKFEGVSCLVPRGKHTLYICEDEKTIFLKGKNTCVKIQRISTDDRESFVAIKLDKKFLVISSTTQTQIQCTKGNNKTQDLNNICLEIKEDYMGKILSILGVDTVNEAVSTNGINCYFKSNMGKLNLVESVGLLFSRPPLLVQHKNMEKIEWVNGSARFINLCVNDSTEFSSINRELAQEINSFIKKLCAHDEGYVQKMPESRPNCAENHLPPSDNKDTSTTVRSKRNAARAAREATRMELQNMDQDGNESDSSGDYQLVNNDSDDDDDETASTSSSTNDDDEEEDTSSDTSTISATDEKPDLKPPAKKKFKPDVVEKDVPSIVTQDHLDSKETKAKFSSGKQGSLISFFNKKK